MENLVIFLFGVVVGYIIWDGSGNGGLVDYTNELPDCFMKVISTDKTSTVLAEVGVGRNRFLVSTEVFGGKPIRPTDVVRKIRNNKEREDLGIPVLGYPPLVKEENFNLNLS
jgi:hypothetical protein